MKAAEFINEGASIKSQIISAVKKDGGQPNEYFVRFTDSDKLGFSGRQQFNRTPDVDDPNFDIDYVGNKGNRLALWLYPLNFYLKQQSAFATEQPYVWLVRIKPDAWLQTVKSNDNPIQSAPDGKQRVGILKMSQPPAAVFFEPAFDVVGKFYNYAGQHQRHGQVLGAPKPDFFDRVRGT